MKRVLPSACLLAATFASCALSQTLALARAAGRQGRADDAIAQATQVASANPASMEPPLLLCQVYGTVDQFDEAIRNCEAAHLLQPSNSSVTLELAHAYGAKADHAGPFTGMRMVGRIRDNFEAAAQQNPKSVDALSDLGEFYVDAPGVVGGGLDKARAIVPRLTVLSAARGHRLAAMIAAKAGDTATADAEFARELAVAPTPEAYVDQANYEKKRKRYEEAETNALLAIQKDTQYGLDSVDAARLLIEIKRSVPAAEAALRAYLGHDQPTAATPFAKIHVQLGQSLQQHGDTAGAQQQYAEALKLAQNYEPARKALRR